MNWVRIFLRNKEVNNAGWLIGGRLAQMILSFFVSVITARFLGPSNYGLINYGSAYVAFFTSICTLGINSVIIKDFLERPDEQGKTIGTAIALRLLSSALSSLMVICIVSILDHDEPTTILVTGLCSVSLIFQVFDTINYWFQSRYESKVTSIVALIAYCATSLYKIALLILNKNVLWFAFATSVDYICVAILLFIAYKKKNGPKLSFSWTKGKQLLNKSYHFILSGMMVAVYAQTDKLMLKQMLDEVSVGYYSLAASLNTMWVFILSAIIDSMYPTIMKLYQNNRKQFEKKNKQLYAIVIYISIAVAICFMFMGKSAIKILYGDAFVDAAMPLKIICWYTIFSYLGVARNAWIVCENKQKYLKYMYFSAAIINVVLNMIFIPIMGATGAALASLITQVCTSMILPCFWKDMRPNVRLMIDAFLLRGIK